MKILPVLSYSNNYAKTNFLNTNKSMSDLTTVFNKKNVLSDTVSFSGNGENDLKDPVLFDETRFSQLFNGKAKEMFEKLHIKILDNKDGFLTISRYGVVWDGNLHCIFPMDFKINENELFKYIKVINGDASFGQSSVTCLGNLESIGGNVSFADSKILSLGKLKNIGGDVDFYYSNVINIGDLENVGSVAYVPNGKKTLRHDLEKRGIYCRQMVW